MSSPKLIPLAGLVCLISFMGLACTEDAGALGPADAGGLVDQGTDVGFPDVGGLDGGVRHLSCTLPGDAGRVGHGMVSGHSTRGSPPCYCADVPESPCFEDDSCVAGCAAVGVDGGLSGTCTSNADCGDRPYAVCLYTQGCNMPTGYCVVSYNGCYTTLTPTVATAATTGQTHCGCDGVTYEGGCPIRPYAHSGACE